MCTDTHQNEWSSIRCFGSDVRNGTVREKELLYGAKSVPKIFRNQNRLTSYSNNDILMLSKEKRYFCKKCKGERYV